MPPLSINTEELDPTKLDVMQNEWVYNALDCAVTNEVWDVIKDQAPEAHRAYNFVSGMQAVSLQLATRGIKIDIAKRDDWIAELSGTMRRLETNLNRLAEAVWDQPLNSNSPKQLNTFFYKVLGVPEQTRYDKATKSKTVTTDRNALEKLADYYHARPFVKHILRIRELKKKIGTLKTGVDSDQRMRTSYNVCGTETGRWSSNENCFGTGTNLQNWADELREIFIPDDGYKLAYIDLEQAESRVVAYLSGDENYIEACESGDLHTTVTRMIWDELPWDEYDDERKCAEQKYYRDFSYRDMAKRGGHGTNYYGKPLTMAKHLHIPTKVMEDFQADYFEAFPGIPLWHKNISYELQTTGKLTTPLGRTRKFLGRLWGDDTLKEAIAFLPQSTIGEILNEGMYQVWWKYDYPDHPLGIQVLAQLHDAILIQYPDKGDEHEKKCLEAVQKTIEVPIPIGSRTLVIPSSVEGTGWNWRKYHKDKNPQGLKSFNGHEPRKRQQREDTRLPVNFVL